MFNKTLKLSRTLTMALLAMGLLACEGEETNGPAINCGAGTALNAAGDLCEPNLSVDVAIDDEDTIVPTDAYAEQVCTDAGGAFDAETGACAPAYDCFRGGYCSEAARLGFEAEAGNLYDGDTLEGSGCARGGHLFAWEAGERIFRVCRGGDQGACFWDERRLREEVVGYCVGN